MWDLINMHFAKLYNHNVLKPCSKLLVILGTLFTHNTMSNENIVLHLEGNQMHFGFDTKRNMNFQHTIPPCIFMIYISHSQIYQPFLVCFKRALNLLTPASELG